MPTKLVRGSKGSAVRYLQECLNAVLVPPPGLPVTGTFGPQTHEAVIRFQVAHQIAPAAGIVGPRTWARLSDLVRAKRGADYVQLHAAAELLARGGDVAQLNLLTGRRDGRDLGPLNIGRAKFFELYIADYGVPSTTALAALNQILSSMDVDPDLQDVRWAAYMLATVKHECADRWLPIEEFGKGANKAYSAAVEVKGADGKTYSNVYYGRGFVQLTWATNYKKASAALGLGEKLYLDPSLAMDASNAYRIMSLGMRDGMFTGKKLSDYINAAGCDYRNARRIINAMDQADRIKTYAESLEAMLRASCHA